MEWKPETVDLRQLVTEATGSVSQLLTERGVCLECRLPDKVALGHVDRDRILRVIINLLSNACKFCPEQGGRVETRLVTTGAGVQLCVSDNGPGIPSQQLVQVFDKFHQVPAGQGGATHGTGSGLAICRGIIKHHGGRIWAESPPGKGPLSVSSYPPTCRSIFWIPRRPESTAKAIARTPADAEGSGKN